MCEQGKLVNKNKMVVIGVKKEHTLLQVQLNVMNVQRELLQEEVPPFVKNAKKENLLTKIKMDVIGVLRELIIPLVQLNALITQ